MCDERSDPWVLIDASVAQHERHGWTLLWRADDPPRARMRLVVEPPERLPMGMVGRPASLGRQMVCRDIMLDDAGRVVWPTVPCGTQELGDPEE
jgi:hypothetical protein